MSEIYETDDYADMTYRVLWNKYSEGLEQEVMQYLEDGWECTGGVAYVVIDNNEAVMVQAMVRVLDAKEDYEDEG